MELFSIIAFFTSLGFLLGVLLAHAKNAPQAPETKKQKAKVNRNFLSDLMKGGDTK